MSDIQLDKKTISQIQEAKKQIARLENNIIMLVTGFMNAKNRDISKYQFNKDYTKLEMVVNNITPIAE